jgi:pyroglutamyl-peptidase
MKKPKLIVLTGFEPFAGFPLNPSWEAAKAFNDRGVGHFKVKSFQVPLRYKEIKATIEEIIDTQKPAIMIGLGQSYRPVISLEKIATNFADLTETSVLYNCGSRPEDETLEPEAPAAYFTTLPVREILGRMRDNAIPSEISYTAGTFGCNQLFFHMMHKIHIDGQDMPAGFIHVPSLPLQAAQLQEAKKGTIPCMELERIIKAIEIAVEVTVESMRR